eukprot:3711859-Pleurochrysis_carterae.AAC.1
MLCRRLRLRRLKLSLDVEQRRGVCCATALLLQHLRRERPGSGPALKPATGTRAPASAMARAGSRQGARVLSIHRSDQCTRANARKSAQSRPRCG